MISYIFTYGFFTAKLAITYYLDLFESLYKKFNNSNCKIILGPSWVQGSTDEFLVQIKEKADKYGGIPIHIHILQTPIQKAYGIKKYGKSLLAHMEDLGLIDNNLVCGHAVYLDKDDIERLAKKEASMTNHASCNLAVRNGIAPIYEYIKAGINVALGIDDKGINDDEDAIMELRMINYLNRVSGYNLLKNPPLDAFDILKIGTINTAKTCGYDDIGKILPGMKADIVILNLEDIMNSPWVSSDLNIAELFLYRAKGEHVDTVIINGEVVMDKRKFLNCDIDSLYEQIREEARKGLDEEAKIYADNLIKIKPYYQNWYNNMLNGISIEPYYKMNSKI